MGTKVNSVEGQPSEIVEAIGVLCNIIPERVLSCLKRIEWFFMCTPMYWQQKKALATLRKNFAKV